MIELLPFSIDHFAILRKEILDERFLMQWAGPKYSYPLSWFQMRKQMVAADESGKKNYLFSVKIQNSKDIIGHVQLSIIDRIANIGNIGSVLVFHGYRKKGIGKIIMIKIMDFGFNNLYLDELRLGVFDFNFSAISCYQKMGFREYEVEENARKVGNEKWNLIRMQKRKEGSISH
ncbi:GNAT family N-acetyltransferase [Spirochaeta dissipatitropha]